MTEANTPCVREGKSEGGQPRPAQQGARWDWPTAAGTSVLLRCVPSTSAARRDKLAAYHILDQFGTAMRLRVA
jgi:hypothetical protein